MITEAIISAAGVTIFVACPYWRYRVHRDKADKFLRVLDPIHSKLNQTADDGLVAAYLITVQPVSDACASFERYVWRWRSKRFRAAWDAYRKKDEKQLAPHYHVTPEQIEALMYPDFRLVRRGIIDPLTELRDCAK